MKRADVELRLPERARHPIHRLIDESDAVARDVLVQGSVLDADRDTFLFYGEGDPETYADALDAVDRVVSFDVTRVDENGFYAFLTQRRDAVDEATFRSLERPGLLVLPPVEFLPEGRARLSSSGAANCSATRSGRCPSGSTTRSDASGRIDAATRCSTPGSPTGSSRRSPPRSMSATTTAPAPPASTRWPTPSAARRAPPPNTSGKPSGPR